MIDTSAQTEIEAFWNGETVENGSERDRVKWIVNRSINADLPLAEHIFIYWMFQTYTQVDIQNVCVYACVSFQANVFIRVWLKQSV